MVTQDQYKPLELRDYQVECLQENALRFVGHQTRLLNALPTGCGKTVIFSQVPRWFDERTLVIAHREELLDQAQAQIQRANPLLSVGIEQAERHASQYDDVVVASVQTLINPARLDSIIGEEGFGVVVIDEAHHAIAASYIKVLARLNLAPDISDLEDESKAKARNSKQLNEALRERYKDFRPDPYTLLMGFTATPHRTDGVGLQHLFDEMAYSRTIEEMMRAGWLCDVKGRKLATGTDITKVKTAGGDYREKDLALAVNTADRNRLAVDFWESHAVDRQTIVFCVDVEHTKAMCEAFQERGFRADYVVGETPKDDRRGVIEAFKSGQLQVLTNCMVLTEGFDHAPTSCLVMARPTKSSLLYTQMLGRGTRLSPETGKTELLVLDLEDVAKAGVAGVNTIFGLPPRLDTEKGVLETKQELDDILEEFPVSQGYLEMANSLDDVRQLAQDFNPLQQAAMPEWLDKHLELQWVRTSFGYTLSIKGLSVGVVEDMLEHCTVELRGQDKKTLGQFPTALDALQVAEEYLAQNMRDDYEFSRKKAAWRVKGQNERATSNQLYHLRKSRMNFPADITKADASILLSRYFAQKGGR